MKINRLLLSLMLGLLLVSACKNKTVTGDNSAQLAAIPNDAFIVIGFEAKQLIKKGGLDNLDDFKSYKILQQEMQAEDSQDQMKSFEQFIKNPESLGLKNDQAYVYGVKQNDQTMYWAFLLRIDNMKTFEDSFAKLAEKDAIEFKDKGSYKIAANDNGNSDNPIFLWNKELLAIVVGKSLDSDLESLLTRPQEQSILSNDDFVEFQKHPYDIGLWMANSCLADLYKNTLGINVKLPIWEDMKGIYSHVYTNFEDGEIKTTCFMSPKAKAEEFSKKYNIAKTDFDKDLLNDFPAKSFLLVKMSINVKEYFNLVTQTSKEMLQSMPDDYPGDELENTLNSPATQTIINGLAGDMLISLYDFAKGPLPMPLMSMSFNVKSEQDFTKIMDLFPPNTFTKNEKGYYTMTSMPMVSIYVAYKDNKVYTTNDADAITAFMGKGFSDNLSKGELETSLKNDIAVFYLNLDIDSYPQALKMALQQQTGNYYNTILSYMSIYKDFTYKVNKDNKLEFSLRFKNQRQNALKQILKNVDENVDSSFH